MDNAGGSEPCGKRTCHVCDHIITTNTFTKKHVEKCLKFKVGPLTVTSKKFMLEKLKESFALGLLIIKVNTNLPEKENRIYHSRVFTPIMFKIAKKVLMNGMSLYFRILERTNNLKKEKIFVNTN